MLWEIEARDGASGARDALKAQPADRARRAADGAAGHPGAAGWRAVAARGAARRCAAHEGRARGGLRLALQPRLADGLPGVRDWFANYPFACLEQKTSKALGLRDARLWQAVVAQMPTYLDGDGLAGYFPPRDGDSGPRQRHAHRLPAGRSARGRDHQPGIRPAAMRCARRWNAA